MTVQIFKGDCRDVLRSLPSESVHCVVTSPPYWGLRDYGVGGQIGLESTYTEYVETMVAVFCEVRRVLRADGTVWLNLGDSYAGSWGNQGRKDERGTQRPINGGMLTPVHDGRYPTKQSNTGKIADGSGLKPKDLCGIPWRVAFALQADSWYLRQDIIWSKPNPMPESVTTRCTKSHEYIFLLSKSARYYYDAEAIAEPSIYAGDVKDYTGDQKNNQTDPILQATRIKNKKLIVTETRNKRSVWEIATSPFPEAHFATFPPALIEPCILAGCPKECCAKCGAPSTRDRPPQGEAESDGPQSSDWADSPKSLRTPRQDGKRWNQNNGRGFLLPLNKPLGWSPSCSCNAGSVSGTCLDPFGGAGTTGLVADRLGRNAILIELNSEYAAMAERRIKDDAGMFAQVAAE